VMSAEELDLDDTAVDAMVSRIGMLGSLGSSARSAHERLTGATAR
jgi:hypothetical protein